MKRQDVVKSLLPVYKQIERVARNYPGLTAETVLAHLDPQVDADGNVVMRAPNHEALKAMAARAREMARELDEEAGKADEAGDEVAPREGEEGGESEAPDAGREARDEGPAGEAGNPRPEPAPLTPAEAIGAEVAGAAAALTGDGAIANAAGQVARQVAAALGADAGKADGAAEAADRGERSREGEEGGESAASDARREARDERPAGKAENPRPSSRAPRPAPAPKPLPERLALLARERGTLAAWQTLAALRGARDGEGLWEFLDRAGTTLANAMVRDGAFSASEIFHPAAMKGERLNDVGKGMLAAALGGAADSAADFAVAVGKLAAADPAAAAALGAAPLSLHGMGDLREALGEVNGALWQAAAMYRYWRGGLGQFIADVDAGKMAEQKAYYPLGEGYAFAPGLHFDLPSDTAIHDLNGHDGQDALARLPEILSAINPAEVVPGGEPRYSGKPWMFHAEVGGRHFGGVFETFPSGRAMVATVFEDAEAGIKNWLANSQGALDQSGAVWSGYLSSLAPSPTNGNITRNPDHVNPQNPRRLYQIIGAQGAAALDARRREQAAAGASLLEGLRAAKEMAAAGKDARAVRLATGWEKGADGKWRHEVADMTIPSEVYDLLVADPEQTRRQNFRLGDLLPADAEVLQAYDKLRYIPVNFDDLHGALGRLSYGVYFEGIDLDVSLLGKGKAGALNAVLTHEVQHWIQYHEGFATGGGFAPNPETETLRNRAKSAQAEADRLRDAIDADIGTREKLKEHMANKGGVAAWFAWLEQARAGHPLHAQWQQAEAEANEYHKAAKEAGMVRLDDGRTVTPEDAYHRSAGEVEARNAEARMGLTAAERRERLLSETADVATEEQIVIMDGQGAAMALEREEEARAERRTRAKFAAMPVIKYDSNEHFGEGKELPAIPEGDLDKGQAKTLRDAVKKWAKAHFPNAPIKNADTGWDVLVTAKGAEDTASHGFDSLLVKSMPLVPELVQSGIFLETNVRKDGMFSHVFANRVEIDGKEYVVGIVVREDRNGRRFYDHELTEIISPDRLEPGRASSEESLGHRTDQGSTYRNDGTVINILREKLGVNNGTGNILFQPAWHGSPHRFSKFTLDHVGSGEGAQAHGWGLYFAQDREVSERYRNELSKRQIKYVIGDMSFYYANGWRNVTPTDLYGFATEAQTTALMELDHHNGDKTKALEKLREYYLYYSNSAKNILDGADKEEGERLVKEAKKYGDALKLLEQNEVAMPTRGRLYHVDVPENDVLLDEQKTLDEQPEKVKAAIREIWATIGKGGHASVRAANAEHGADGAAPSHDDVPWEWTGKRLYDEIANREYERLLAEGREESAASLGGDRAASLLLNQHGVKGITYDGQQDGRCFVVFDDQAITMLDTLYQQAGGAEGLNAARDEEARAKAEGEADPEEAVATEAAAEAAEADEGAPRESGEGGETKTPAAPGPRGSIDLFANVDGDRIVTIFRGADPTTICHEMCHWLTLTLEEATLAGEATEEHARMYGRLRAAGGLREGERFADNASAAANERVAKLFERFLSEGRAPSLALVECFASFRDWMLDLYERFVGGDEGVGKSEAVGRPGAEGAGVAVLPDPLVPFEIDRQVVHDQGAQAQADQQALALDAV